jgi:cytochrome P450
MGDTSPRRETTACPYHAMHADEAVPAFKIEREHPLDPPSQVALLREKGLSKVKLWDGSETWLATRYEDVRNILGDTRFSTVTTRPGYPFVSAARKEILINGRPNFTFMDAPEHTKFRRMMARMFTVERFEKLRPYVETVVEGLLDELEQHSAPVDFVAHFSNELPVRILAKLVGIPKEGQEIFLDAGKKRFDLAGNPGLSHDTGEVLWRYLDNLLAEQERNPGTGEEVITKLVVEQIQPGKISRDDAILVINQLLVAGHDTTANTIAIGTLALLRNRHQFELLRRDPSKIGNAVNEILRYATILQFHASRAATEDVQVGGQTIKAGEGVIALLHGANRDASEFNDPDKFDIERDASHHMAFSYGIHQCLGQSLARLELGVVFNSLAKRFPNLRLTQPVHEIDFATFSLAYGPLSFDVEW